MVSDLALSPAFRLQSRNRLLNALPRAEWMLIEPRLEPVTLVLREILITPSEPIASMLFPLSGWTSHLIALQDGDMGEVGLVGREGMIGLPLLFGQNRSPLQTIVQASGHALRLPAETCCKTLAESPALRALLHRYTLATVAHVAQIAACNGRHHVEQRLARWLLMAHDRADSNVFPMTHEFLSIMLGVRRAGITEMAGTLQRAGLIRYERGAIEITNRSGLEDVSCECYGAIRHEYEEQLDPGWMPPSI